jgi:N-acetylglucosamine kinase-like BadF-type ATPase
MTLAIGVDVGGTWVRVVALSDGKVVARRARRGPVDLARFLRLICRQQGWSRANALVVASRGVWAPRERAALRARVRGLARATEAISDAEAAYLGALGPAPGILVLAGTGSIVLGRTARGAWIREGGLGPLLGDEGSGFWIGREWLRACDPEQGRRLARAPDAVARIAALAPGVLARARRGDRVAREIVRGAQEHLAVLAAEVARRLGGRVDASWAGGLLDDRAFRAGVARALARRKIRARWRAPRDEPALAAARAAERLAAR